MSKNKAEQMKPSSNQEAVKVAIRCRPMSEKEMNAGNETIVKINTKSGEIFVSKPSSDEPPKQFTFDMAFDWNVE